MHSVFISFIFHLSLSKVTISLIVSFHKISLSLPQKGFLVWTSHPLEILVYLHEVKVWVANQAAAYPSLCSIKWLGVFCSPLDGMIVNHRVITGIKFAGTHLYTWVERGTVRVKFLAQEHNIVLPARSWTRATQSGKLCTNNEVTLCYFIFIVSFTTFDVWIPIFGISINLP